MEAPPPNPSPLPLPHRLHLAQPGHANGSRREPNSKGGRLLEIITQEAPSICDRLRALGSVVV
jgi:hypothetical protein